MYAILTALRVAAENCVFVPNTCEHPDDVDVFGPSRTIEVLPPALQNHVYGGRTVAELNADLDRAEEARRPTKHARDKMAKAENAAAYAAEWAANGENGEFDYARNADSVQLLKNQQTFVELMLEAGHIEDLDE